MKHIVPTTEEKLLIYKGALKYVNGECMYCICPAMGDAMLDLKMYDGYGYVNGYARWKRCDVEYDLSNNMKANFPELYKRKPKHIAHVGDAWWDTTSDKKPNGWRVRALNAIIAELEAKVLAEQKVSN